MFQNFQILRNLTMQVYCDPHWICEFTIAMAMLLDAYVGILPFYVGGTIHFRNNISYVKFKREKKLIEEILQNP